ncbi:MAG: glycosyltransferase family 2 protein [Nitrosopumilus sp.]
MKSVHSRKNNNPRIGVVIPARNEFNNISSTLQAINQQTLQPTQIIVVDDYSNDGTGKLADSFTGVTVVRFPHNHESWVIKKELAQVFNLGLEQLSSDLDFVTIVGADDVLPSNYLEYVSDKMIQEGVTMASGQIGDEVTTIPRGSGRLVDWKWWKSIGGRYPINYGYESWLLAKCISNNKVAKIYPEIKSRLQRPTGANYAPQKYIHRGQAYKALGYNHRFVVGRFVVMILKKRQLFSAIKMIWGYLRYPVEQYEDDVRNYYRTYQDKEMSVKNIFSLAKRFINA